MRLPLLLGLAIFASIANAQSLSQPDIKNLLVRAASANVSADFREEKKIHLLNKPITSVGKLRFHAPNKFRREAGGNSPSVMVSNGQDLWIYYPNFKSAERYSLGRHSPLDAVITAINAALNLKDVENNFQITGANIDNGYELQLQPRSAATRRLFQRLTLRLNDELFATRTDILQPNGDQIVTAYSNQTRAAIPASTFEFTPPPGTAISTPLGR